ncbi:MAG: hypothetical protein J3Q66DRAFT_444712 [Benniella sp.]|nr:MAG: hypothetical protein J3Q66DRAFT_444712 [Benniella sp.]
MGILKPSCVTARDGRIYAFGTATSYSTSDPSQVYFLVVSNSNPSQTLEDLSWTLVSAVPTTGYAEIYYADILGFHSGPNYSCTIDDKGVFSIIFKDDHNGVTSGLQFQPSPAGTSGTGTWKNITIPLDYKWTPLRFTELFNYKDIQGMNTLMHATVEGVNDVRVAALDPTTMTMNQGLTPWNISGVSTTYVRVVTSNGKSIFGYGDISIVQAWLFEHPLTSASLSPSGSPKRYNASEIYAVNPLFKSVIIKPIGNNIFIMNAEATPVHIFVFDGTGFTHLPAVPEGVPAIFSFEFLTGVDAFPVPFIYYGDKKGIHGIPISGPLAGIRVTAKNNISISEPYGTPPPSPSSPSSSSSSPSVSLLPTWTVDAKRSGGKTGAVIGGVCAVVVVVIAVLGFLFYRRKRQLEQTLNSNHQSNNSTEPVQPTHQDPKVKSTGTMENNTPFTGSKEEYPY